jgi:succinyl-diaminopimelate desuccinylase
MKSGVAAAVVATVEHAARPHSCRGVQLVLTAGEETGCTGLLGLDPPGRDALAKGGPLVVAEPTANELVLGHKGAHWMQLRATGRAAHGSAPELGDNAVVRLARAAVALHDHAGWPRHERFSAVTANVGVLRGGVAPNVVPDAAEMLLDIRTVPGLDSSELRAQVSGLVGERVDVTDHVVLPPVDTSTDDPFVGLVRSALQSTGFPDEPVPPARYFTDASVLAGLLGEDGPAPTVVLGPGEPAQCHVVDEYCLAGRVEQAVVVYRELLDRWCRG